MFRVGKCQALTKVHAASPTNSHGRLVLGKRSRTQHLLRGPVKIKRSQPPVIDTRRDTDLASDIDGTSLSPVESSKVAAVNVPSAAASPIEHKLLNSGSSTQQIVSNGVGGQLGGNYPVPAEWQKLATLAAAQTAKKLFESKISWRELTDASMKRDVKVAKQEAPQQQPDSSPRGFGSATSTSVLKLFRYAVDKSDVEKAIFEAGLEGQVILTERVDSADAVIAIKLTRGGKHINLSQAERTARNAGVPLIVAGRKMNEGTLKRSLEELLKSKGIKAGSTTASQSSSMQLARPEFNEAAFFSDDGRQKSKVKRRNPAGSAAKNAAAKESPQDSWAEPSTSHAHSPGRQSTVRLGNSRGGATTSPLKQQSDIKGTSLSSEAGPIAPQRAKLFPGAASPGISMNKQVKEKKQQIADVPTDARIDFLERKASRKKRQY